MKNPNNNPDSYCKSIFLKNSSADVRSFKSRLRIVLVGKKSNLEHPMLLTP